MRNQPRAVQVLPPLQARQWRTQDEIFNDILSRPMDGGDARFLRKYAEHTGTLIASLRKKVANQRRALVALNRALIVAKYDRDAAQHRARKVERRAKQ